MHGQQNIKKVRSQLYIIANCEEVAPSIAHLSIYGPVIST